jgi:hypothetical protein
MSQETLRGPDIRAGRLGEAARDGDSVEWLARVGLVAEAVLYVALGILAAQVALDGRDSSHRPDAEGALQLIADQPFGKALLVLVALGFLALASWRTIEAIFDRDKNGSDSLGLLKRAGLLALGALYLGLTGLTLAIALGKKSGDSGSEQEREVTQGVLGWPLGRPLVLAAGAALVIGAAVAVVRALRGRHDDEIDWQQLSPRARQWVSAIGAIGLSSRAAVFAIIGVFLIRAAWEHDPSETRGLDGALLELAQATGGPVLLSVLVLGFLAFSAWCLLQARYRRI